MRILVTNDDGILAPGISALYRAVADLGHVDVVAPETTQSAMGHAITIKTPMLVRRVHVNNTFHGWAVDGRPADCVKLAMKELLDEPPDFVVSGINHGANTGVNVLYSGTVAGAAEGSFFGPPSMAFSLELSEKLDFEKAEKIAREMFIQYAKSKPHRGMCLNVNFPPLDHGWPRGVKCTPMGLLTMDDHYIKERHEDGTMYWLDGKLPDHQRDPQSDLAALRENYVSVTPLKFELTHLEQLKEVAEWKWPQQFGAAAPGPT
ncbi:MAG: 5'/3'-nucleotidase SurE [Phycisphaerae bacterium]